MVAEAAMVGDEGGLRWRYMRSDLQCVYGRYVL